MGRERWGALARMREGACLNASSPQGGSTPLHCAAFDGHVAMVALLLAAGAAVGGETKVRGEGRFGKGRAGMQNTAFHVLLGFLLCAFPEADQVIVGFFVLSTTSHPK